MSWESEARGATFREPRTHMMQVRMTPGEREELEEASSVAGMTASEVVRVAIREWIEREQKKSKRRRRG
jgi:hypothetical protein